MTVNVLSAVDSGFESGIGNWIPVAYCSLASSTAAAHSGTHSLAVTATAAQPVITEINYGVYPASPGQVWEATAWLLAATTPETWNVFVTFFNSSGIPLGGGEGSGPVADNTSTWTQIGGPGTAPATTAWVTAYVTSVTSLANGEVHHIDDVDLETLTGGNFLPLMGASM
jgi:hypothetical protein